MQIGEQVELSSKVVNSETDTPDTAKPPFMHLVVELQNPDTAQPNTFILYNANTIAQTYTLADTLSGADTTKIMGFNSSQHNCPVK